MGRGDRSLVHQVEQVFPHLVGVDTKGRMAIDAGGVLMTLIQAVGEVETRIESLEERLDPQGDTVRETMIPAEDSAVAKIRQLRGVTWEWRDEVSDEIRKGPGLGVIAQDVERVFPELVIRGPEGHLKVHYYGLIGPLIEAVRELDDRLVAVERRPHDLG